MKRRVLDVFLAVLLVLGFALGGICCAQDNSCGNNAFWSFDGETGTLTITGTGPMSTNQNTPWNDLKEEILSVVIEEGITTVGSSAFRGCTNLKTVSLPESLTAIEYGAFHSCTSLESIAFPEGLTRFGEFTFSGCKSLKRIVIPSGVTRLGEFEFGNCSALESVVLPEGLLQIGDMTFSNCTSLMEITIPSTVSSLRLYSFQGCTALNTVHFLGDAPDFIESFSGVTATVYYPGGNSTWTAEKKINYGGKLIWTADDVVLEGSCGTKAYWKLDTNTGALTVFGSGEIVSDQTWRDMEQLVTSVVIQNGITAVESSAFSFCGNLTSVKIAGSVTTLGSYAFDHCPNLTNVELCEGLQRIGYNAFDSCTGLKSIRIPKGVTQIGDLAFRACTALEEVILPEGLTKIEEGTFGGGCGLASITIPASVTAIEGDSFEDCAKLKTVTFLADAPTIHDYAFAGVTATARYPGSNPTWTAEKKQNYGGTLTWLPVYEGAPCGENAYWTFDEETGILIISGTGAIDDYSEKNTAPWYSHRSDICKVVVAEGITRIGSHAFLDCGRRLKEVQLPKGLLTIGDYAFADCVSLQTVNIPNTVTAVEHHAFYYCFVLDGINLPDSVTTLGVSAFENCSGMTQITLSKNLTGLGDFLFFRCSGLKSITIPEGVTTIGNRAFYACQGLESITFPKNLVSIGTNAFNYCGSLTDIRFRGNAPTIGSDAFGTVTALVHYPANRTWTAGVRQNYGGTLTWNAVDPVTGGEIICENGIYYYYIDNALQYAAGLVCVNGDYYYIRSGGHAAIGAYWCTNTNGITQEGFYIFAEDGKMILNDDSKTGIYLEDGKYYYYIDGEIQFAAGLVMVDGSYYYIRSGGYAAIGSYWVTNTNGITDEGFYIFAEDGKMILNDESKTGIYLEDGKFYYYMDGEIQFGAGLIFVDGYYYYIRSGGYAAIGEYYVSNTNGLLPEGFYTFRWDGKMIL